MSFQKRKPKGPPPPTSAFDVYQYVRDTSTRRGALEITELLFEAAFLSLLAVDPEDGERNPFTNWILDTAHEDLKVPSFVDRWDDLARTEHVRRYGGRDHAPQPRNQPGLAVPEKPKR